MSVTPFVSAHYVTRPRSARRPRLRLLGFALILTGARAAPAALAQESKPAFEARYAEAARLLEKDHDAGTKQLNEFLGELEAAVARDAKNAELHFLAGEVCFMLEKDDEAGRHYDAAIAVDAKRPDWHFKKGVLLRYKSEPAAAAGEFETVVKLDANHVRGWLELGRARAEQDDATRALPAYEKALALDPKLAAAHFGAGCALIELNRREEAIKSFERVTELDPQSLNALCNLGQTYQDLGRHADSLAAFRKVADLDPDDYRVRSKIMQCCEALGKKGERDKEHARLLELFKAGKCDGKLLYCRDQFAAGDKWVMALEYFEMDFSKQDWPIRYSFAVQKSREQTKELLFRITLGSYNETTEFGRASGKLGKDERYWHLDRYYTDEKHETFRFFTREPTYDDVKKLVLEILSGKREAISSMTPTSQGSEIEVSP